MRKTNNKTKKRDYGPISAKGLATVMCFIVAVMWIGDGIARRVHSKDADPREGLVIDGTFAGDENAKKPVPTETQAPQTDPASDPQQAEFAFPTGVYVPGNCVTVAQDQAALHSGKLLQLDSEHSYSGFEGTRGDFSEKNASYTLRFGGMEIQPCVVDAMNQMALAYETVSGVGDLLVYSTVAASSAEGALYPDELPDRATGYCVDLGYFTEDECIAPMYSMDDWLENNAYLYGFVFSYTQADEERTGIAEAPYHLRYIGRVHSVMMHEQGLTFAEYLEVLKSHTPDAPFTYNDGNTIWSVYYVPAGAGTTNVPVPKNGNYEISGNNTDGFIVTAEGTIGS